jgi:CBS domain-containing protein
VATLFDLLALKGRDVVAVRPTDTVLHAANLMNERNIGGLLVLEGDHLAGIFTERDVLRRVVAARLDPATTPVSAVMTAPVITGRPELSVDDCASLMTTKGIRHLPVRDAEGLAGMVSIRDLLAHKVSEQQTTIAQMNSYLYDVR